MTNNRKKQLIAELHDVVHRLLHRREAVLEVAPAGLAVLDLIVVSLVYVECERRRRDSGGGFGRRSKGDDGGR